MSERKIWRWECVTALLLQHGLRYGAELGVKEGRFTAYLIHNVPECSIIAVDLWGIMPERNEVGAETYKDWPQEEYYRNLVAWAKDKPVEVKRMLTSEAALEVPDGSLDFVFIDADHTASGVRRDILEWTPKVRKGGLISGHDINWPTVRGVVEELFPNYLKGSDNVWYVIK